MSTQPFSFHNPTDAARFNGQAAPQLLKLKPGVEYHVFFGLNDFSRMLVPIHWNAVGGKSSLCAGQLLCGHCDQGMEPQWHLYAGVYLAREDSRKAVVDLGTSITAKWKKLDVDLSQQYKLLRKDKYGPVALTKIELYTGLKNVREGWSIRADLDRIFRGRCSPTVDRR